MKTSRTSFIKSKYQANSTCSLFLIGDKSLNWITNVIFLLLVLWMITSTLQILIDSIYKIITTKICQRLGSKMTFCSFSLDLFLTKCYKASLKPVRLIIWDYSFWIEYFKDLKMWLTTNMIFKDIFLMSL